MAAKKSIKRKCKNKNVNLLLLGPFENKVVTTKSSKFITCYSNTAWAGKNVRNIKFPIAIITTRLTT